MDFQIAFNIAMGLVGFLGGWVLNNIHNAMRDLQVADRDLAEKVSGIEILVAGDYVRRSEFDKTVERLFLKLDNIEMKISSKVDR